MIRVNHLEESIKFYTDVLGMKLLSLTDYPEGEFTLAFVGFGATKSEPCIELTYNYGKHAYQLGDAFGHIAFATDDIKKICELTGYTPYKIRTRLAKADEEMIEIVEAFYKKKIEELKNQIYDYTE